MHLIGSATKEQRVLCAVEKHTNVCFSSDIWKRQYQKSLSVIDFNSRKYNTQTMLQIHMIVDYYLQLGKKKILFPLINLSFDQQDVLYREVVVREALISVLIWTNLTFL